MRRLLFPVIILSIIGFKNSNAQLSPKEKGLQAITIAKAFAASGVKPDRFIS